MAPHHNTPKPPRAPKTPKAPKPITAARTYTAWYALLIIGCIVGGTLGIGYRLLGWGGTTTPPATPVTTPPTTADYSLSVIDGPTGAGRNCSAITVYNYTVLNDYSTYVSTGTYTSEDQIDRTEITRILGIKGVAIGFYASVTAQNNVTGDHNWCAYGTRWLPLNPYGVNIWDFYAAPTQISRATLYQNGTQFTAKNFSAANSYYDNALLTYTSYVVGNFSTLIGMNASDVGWCGYKGFYNPSVAEGAGSQDIYLTINMNNSAVVDPDLILKNVVGGTTNWVAVETLNSTCVAWKATSMLDTSLLNLNWKNGVSVLIRGENVELQFGTKEQVAAHTGTVLATLI